MGKKPVRVGRAAQTGDTHIALFLRGRWSLDILDEHT